jgi:hypothetical protein
MDVEVLDGFSPGKLGLGSKSPLSLKRGTKAASATRCLRIRL